MPLPSYRYLENNHLTPPDAKTKKRYLKLHLGKNKTSKVLAYSKIKWGSIPLSVNNTIIAKRDHAY